MLQGWQWWRCWDGNNDYDEGDDDYDDALGTTVMRDVDGDEGDDRGGGASEYDRKINDNIGDSS